jgi:hypothetical protein
MDLDEEEEAEIWMEPLLYVAEAFWIAGRKPRESFTRQFEEMKAMHLRKINRYGF